MISIFSKKAPLFLLRPKKITRLFALLAWKLEIGKLLESIGRSFFFFWHIRNTVSFMCVCAFVCMHSPRIGITLTLLRGWWGRCKKTYLRKKEGREGGEKSTRSVPAGPGARTRDLPRARRGSPAARQGGCLGKQAFPCL